MAEPAYPQITGRVTLTKKRRGFKMNGGTKRWTFHAAGDENSRPITGP